MDTTTATSRLPYENATVSTEFRSSLPSEIWELVVKSIDRNQSNLVDLMTLCHVSTMMRLFAEEVLVRSVCLTNEEQARKFVTLLERRSMLGDLVRDLTLIQVSESNGVILSQCRSLQTVKMVRSTLLYTNCML